MEVGRHPRIRAAVLLGALLSVAVLGLGPRAFFPHRPAGGHAPESRRPKTARYLLPTPSSRLASSPRESRDSEGYEALRIALSARAWQGSFRAPGILPPRALGELAKPEYLKAFRDSGPQSQTSPPA